MLQVILLVNLQLHWTHFMRVVAQAGSLTFLSEQGFDFNTWIRNGVSCMPLHVRDSKLAALDEARDSSPIIVRKPEDRAFVEALVGKVREVWSYSDSKHSDLEYFGLGYERGVQNVVSKYSVQTLCAKVVYQPSGKMLFANAVRRGSVVHVLCSTVFKCIVLP